MSSARQVPDTNKESSSESTDVPKKPTSERIIKVAYLNTSGDRQEAWMKESTIPLFFLLGTPRSQ
jgi:hypothetical protein